MLDWSDFCDILLLFSELCAGDVAFAAGSARLGNGGDAGDEEGGEDDGGDGGEGFHGCGCWNWVVCWFLTLMLSG